MGIAQANAAISADGNIDLNAGGGLTVSGGVARADASGNRTLFVYSEASAGAVLAAGQNISFNGVGGDLNINGGIASATATHDCSSCDAYANASATVSGASSVLVSGVTNDLNIIGGTANAVGSGDTCTTCIMVADAGASLDGGTVTINSVGGNLSVIGGYALASPEERIREGFASADAHARLGATSDLSVDVSGAVNVFGGGALAGGFWSWISASTMQAFANGDATVEAGGNLTITAVDGLNVLGGGHPDNVRPGGAYAVPTTFSAAIVGTASASAKAELKAGGQATINVTNGSVALGGGLSNPGNTTGVPSSYSASIGVVATGASGSSGSMPLRKASASASIKAGSLQIVAATDVSGSSATIDAGGIDIAAGNDIVLPASLKVASGNVTMTAGNDILLEGDIGTTAGIYNGSVNLNAHNNVNISADIIVGSHDIGLRADFDGNGFGGVNIDSSAIVEAGGNIAISAASDIDFRDRVWTAGGGLAVTGAGAVFLGSVEVGGDVTISAGSDIDFQSLVQSAGGGLVATAGNDILVSGGIGNAEGSFNGAVNLNANNNVDIDGEIIVGSHDVNLNADADGDSSGDVNIDGSGDGAGRVDTQGALDISGANISLQDATLKAAQLQIMAATDVFGSSAGIDAGGIYIAAGNDLHLFNTTTTVGAGTAPGVSGDPLVLEIMEEVGIPLPANSDPNLKFQAGGSMVSGDIEVTASNAYLWFETDELVVGDMSAPDGPLTVQYSPFTPTLEIVFEDQPPVSASGLDQQGRPDQVNYDNSSHIGSRPITTVVIGSADQSGAITAGANGPIDIVDRNMLLLTTPDDVDSPANVITTGIVATSGFVASVEREPDVFIAPRLDSIEVETEIDTVWDQEQRRKRRLVRFMEQEHGMCTAL
jgi:filamentous hemagglutinin